MPRRSFLRHAGLATGSAMTSHYLAPIASARARGCYLFSLGVASGDPGPDGVVLWTRLAPDPLNSSGLDPDDEIEVCWELALDPHMRRVVRSGEVETTARDGFAVHVMPRGLEADRWYWYRFIARDQESPIGRTRTMPEASAMPRRVRFAVASCQDYELGLYSAYDSLAQEDLDFVVHTGDYIYETGIRPQAIRAHNSVEVTTLQGYRDRYALYKRDPALRAAHAAFPFIVASDDHEVDDDYAGLHPEDDQSRSAFRARRAAAYRAYYEHMPLPPVARPFGPYMRVFRRLRYGRLAQFHVLDTRQFRSPQPCDAGFKPLCPEWGSPQARMTGGVQGRWLLANLAHSLARWNVIAQQVMMTQWDLRTTIALLSGGTAPAPGSWFNMDAWDGYPAERQRLLSFLEARGKPNTVVLSGDIHSHWAADLKADFNKPDSATVGSEIVCTSITSDFPASFIPAVRAGLADNPHIKFFDGAHRGYVICEVTPDLWLSHHRGVDTVLQPTSPTRTLASFALEAGVPGLAAA